MPELVKVASKLDNVRDLLSKMVPQLALAVGTDVTAKRLARIATTSVIRNPALLDCDPKTLMGAVMECAQLGLEPDGREAHLVPFNNRKRNVKEVTLIPDYKGLAKLARNSGQVKTLDWRAVYQGDHFKYQYGSQAKLEHIPSDEPIHKLVPKDPKKPEGEKEWIERQQTHAYALAMLDGGEPVFEVMTVPDIEWHRDQYSRAAGDGPWVTNFDDMSAKTCFRKLSKKIPRSATNDRLARAVELDESAQRGISQSLGDVLLGDALETPTTDGPLPDAPAKNGKLDKLTGELKNNGTTKPHAATTAEAGAGAPEAPAMASTSGGAHLAPAAASAPPAEPEKKPEVIEAPPSAATATTVANPAPMPPPATPKTSGGVTAPAAEHIMDAPRAKVVGRIHDAFKKLELEGDKKKSQREWLYSRYLGPGVKPTEAPLEKMETLAVELEKLAANAKPKK